MSSYREDTQETGVIADSTLSRMKVFSEEIGRIAEALLVGLMISVADAATASDSIRGAVNTAITESVSISDSATGKLYSLNKTTDSATASDRISEQLLVLHTEVAQASDTITGMLIAVTTESAQPSDSVLLQRRVPIHTTESAKVSDTAAMVASALTTESATAFDSFTHKIKARSLTTEAAGINDSITAGRESSGLPFIEVAAVTDQITGRLIATSLTTETVAAEDEPLIEPLGQAWTANVESWAMSRYAPYTFLDIAVIDGVIYGVTDDGLYALDGGTGQVTGALTFGKLDLGGKGGLVHPTAAYLEYEKVSGTAEMDVTTTQSGAAQTYTYQLADEAADQLTNGRFILGKGLRGRHFQLAVRLTADSAYINDLRVSVTPTNRRV